VTLEPLSVLLPGVVADLAHRNPGRTPPVNATHTVWRYMLPITDEPVVRMPAGAQALSVGPSRTGGESIDLWVLVALDADEETREFRLVGTGHPLPDDCGRFIGTTHSHDGALIWHVFEAKA
jgi:hypothetical protein